MFQRGLKATNRIFKLVKILAIQLEVVVKTVFDYIRLFEDDIIYSLRLQLHWRQLHAIGVSAFGLRLYVAAASLPTEQGVLK